jgi:hypothetical protein
MILAVAPALPLHAAGKYVAGAYILFVVMLVVYLAIMALRTGRTNREVADLRQELVERRTQEELDGAGHRPAGGVGSGERRPTPAGEPEREPVL